MKEVEELCLGIASEFPAKEGSIHTQAHMAADGEMKLETFHNNLFFTFYKTGLVGLKIAPDAAASWADDLGQAVTSSQVTEETSVAVHPAYARALGMRVTKT